MKTRREASLTAQAKPIRTAARKRSGAVKSNAGHPATAGDDLLAKHRRVSEMVADLRVKAEALSANADRLLARLA